LRLTAARPFVAANDVIISQKKKERIKKNKYTLPARSTLSSQGFLNRRKKKEPSVQDAFTSVRAVHAGITKTTRSRIEVGLPHSAIAIHLLCSIAPRRPWTLKNVSMLQLGLVGFHIGTNRKFNNEFSIKKKVKGK